MFPKTCIIDAQGQIVPTGHPAGNHAHDSTQPAMCAKDRLPLRTIRKFCIETTREIAVERRGFFAGVERVREDSEP